MRTVDVRELTSKEVKDLTAFQEFIKKLYNAFYNDDTRIKTFRDYQNFKKSVQPYAKYPWTKGIKSYFNEMNKSFNDVFQAKRAVKKTDFSQASKMLPGLLKAIQSMDIDSMNKISIELNKLGSIANKSKVSDKDITSRSREPYKIEDPLFFLPNTFIRRFEPSDMERIATKDLNKFKYTYLTLPETREGDYQYIVHMINELSDSDESVTLSGDEFIKYNAFENDSEEYHALTSKVDRYLHSNIKELIPEIVKGIEQFPALKQANEQAKEEHSILYRGIPVNNNYEEGLTTNDIVQRDREAKFVATTDRPSVATKFAYEIGHLEPDESRRSDEGYVIEYSVTPDAILFDTKIFGGIFGESEVVIDATKAEVNSVKSV